MMIKSITQSLIEHINRAWSLSHIIPGQFVTVVPPQMREGPQQPMPMPGRPDHAYASMGNYLFDTDVRLAALDDAKRRGESDFGRHLLPRLIGECRVCAYDFSANAVPGLRDYEERAYWRDVGTIDTYYAATMDTLGPEPRINLFNPLWPITSSNYQGPSLRIFAGSIKNASLGAGTVIKGGVIKNAVVRREVMVEPGVRIEDSIVMDYVAIRRGAQLRRVIVDRYNEIGAGERIGYDSAADRQRFHVTESGLVVIPKRIASPRGYL